MVTKVPTEGNVSMARTASGIFIARSNNSTGPNIQNVTKTPAAMKATSFTIDAVATGRTGSDAIHFAAEEALSDRLLCNYRQVEEHVRRDDSVRNAELVRNRFEAAHRQIDLSGLARAALGTGEPLTRARAHFADLDAGVPL